MVHVRGCGGAVYAHVPCGVFTQTTVAKGDVDQHIAQLQRTLAERDATVAELQQTLTARIAAHETDKTARDKKIYDCEIQGLRDRAEIAELRAQVGELTSSHAAYKASAQTQIGTLTEELQLDRETVAMLRSHVTELKVTHTRALRGAVQS